MNAWFFEGRDTPPSEENQTDWLDEASRRAQQLDEGSVELISSDVVAAEARALLRR